MSFTIKQGDLRPYMTGQIKNPDDTPVDLTLATSGSLVLRKKDEAAVWLKKEITFTDRVEGRWQYSWSGADTADAGIFDAEIELLWGTEPQTVPVDGYFTVLVVDDIG